MTSYDRIQNENGAMEPIETEIRARLKTDITDEERLIIGEVKGLMIRNETFQESRSKEVKRCN